MVVRGLRILFVRKYNKVINSQINEVTKLYANIQNTQATATAECGVPRTHIAPSVDVGQAQQVKFDQEMKNLWTFPPTLMGGVVSPYSNTGLKCDEQLMRDWQSMNEVALYTDGNKPVLVLVSQAADYEVAFIDQLSFTFSRQTFEHLFSNIEIKEIITPENFNDCMSQLSHEIDNTCIDALKTVMDDIFGFSLGSNGNGRNGYKKSVNLTVENGANCGFIAIGGNSETINIAITGQGCANASYGWQERLYTFLKTAKRAKLTRIDLANDDYYGDYMSIEYMDSLYDMGGFYSFGRPPKHAIQGDWKNLVDGRTIYIGSRGSAKYCRIYEKGKQLKSVDYPDWVRCEVEFHSGDVVLPLDMILKTSEYFLNAYPCFKDLFDRPECEQCKVQYIKRASKIAIDTALTTLKHQFGKYIGFFELWFDDSKIALKAMSSDVFQVPKRLLVTQTDLQKIGAVA